MDAGLINKQVVTEQMMHEAPWADSHGASGHDLGMGLLYYAIVYCLKARVAVCLGSGGGFVPRLMRQAQRDLGIAPYSRTILVDGNVPSAGWGAPAWLAGDSFFRTHFSDIEIVVDLSSSAADRIFDAQNAVIDYLHIDADHSFDGCLADFETYRRFLRIGSIITFHDTNYPSAGVASVIDHIRSLPNFEVVDFPEIGEGTAIVRFTGTVTFRRLASTQPPGSRQSHLISVTKHPEARPLRPPEKQWKYLESTAFSMRYVLAAHFVDPCPSVIEIGGSTTPIDLFLRAPHDAVLVLDPFIKESRGSELNGMPCSVSHVRARFQDVDWSVPAEAEYGLVMLGLEIQGLQPHHYNMLYGLVDRARVTVVEFPGSWPPSREQFELILENTRTRIAHRAKLDLEGNDYGNLENSWPPRCDREIYVLEPR